VLVVSNWAKAGMAAPTATRANAAIVVVVRAMFLVMAEVDESISIFEFTMFLLEFRTTFL
jgi:hypothetical protein